MTSDSVPQQSSASNNNVSASEKKLRNLNNSYKSEFNSGFKNAIADLNILAGVFSEAVKCLQCGATGLNLSCEENCSGGAVELDILYDFCSYSYKFCSSKQCKAEIGKPSTYEISTSFEVNSLDGLFVNTKNGDPNLIPVSGDRFQRDQRMKKRNLRFQISLKGFCSRSRVQKVLEDIKIHFSLLRNKTEMDEK
ncbi:hypothetical protein TNCT_145771 [Trichonephila clavata]|uniref:Uncharacterized protein n=1 Tax=Trichonephila clavata TaxID=2740835 RepID=A0A8X6FRN5_TRICU|nr:hypothetical protein TNCT_145771 [Trichonephila clavata]